MKAIIPNPKVKPEVRTRTILCGKSASTDKV